MAREIARTTDVGGCPMREGQMVLLSFPAANRDPEKFPDAGKILIDRKPIHMPLSGSASIAASAQTWRGWKWWWRPRSG
jgi:cytochrome P450